MAELNRAGVSYAQSLIAAGKVDKTSSWSFSAEDGNALLGVKGDDWSNYGQHHLGVDASANEKTKEYWKYPFAKGGTVYRSGVIAIRQRAAADGDQAIEQAAGRLLEAIDGGKRYSPEQPRDDHGRFADNGGGGGASDAKAKFAKFAKTAGVTLAALALKYYGWQLLPDWAVKIAKKSLRAAELPTGDGSLASPERIKEFLAALSPAELEQLLNDFSAKMSDAQYVHLVAQMEGGDALMRSDDGMADMERRAFASDKLAIEKPTDKSLHLVGHAALFNRLSADIGGFRELIMPGAFADVLKTSDARALFNHDPNFVLGRQSTKTLRLAEDERGLSFEIDLPDTQTVRDLVVTPIERGDISGMSFGFRAAQDGQKWERKEGRMLRTITRFKDLFDVGPVTFPVYQQTDIALRSLQAFEAEERAREQPSTPFNLLRALQQQAGI